jgi:hypothetical protein
MPIRGGASHKPRVNGRSSRVRRFFIDMVSPLRLRWPGRATNGRAVAIHSSTARHTSMAGHRLAPGVGALDCRRCPASVTSGCTAKACSSAAMFPTAAHLGLPDPEGRGALNPGPAGQSKGHGAGQPPRNRGNAVEGIHERHALVTLATYSA